MYIFLNIDKLYIFVHVSLRKIIELSKPAQFISRKVRIFQESTQPPTFYATILKGSSRQVSVQALFPSNTHHNTMNHLNQAMG